MEESAPATTSMKEETLETFCKRLVGNQLELIAKRSCGHVQAAFLSILTLLLELEEVRSFMSSLPMQARSELILRTATSLSTQFSGIKGTSAQPAPISPRKGTEIQ